MSGHRVPGRHRDGFPRVAVRRLAWDGEARAAAQQMQESWPGWTVLYGMHSRRYYAMPAFAPEPIIIEASTLEDLAAQMNETEIHAAHHTRSDGQIRRPQ